VETSHRVLINAFFQVKLKLPLSELIITLKVVTDFANQFRSAKNGADYQLNLNETD